MALSTPELVQTSGSDIFANHKKVSMHERSIAIFGTDAAASTLATCTPVGFNTSTGFYGAWLAPDPTVIVLNEDGVITIDGQDTGTIDVSAATEASVAGELLGIGIVASVSEATDVFTITLDADAQVAVVPTTTATGASNTVTDGTSTYGLSSVSGFVWPDPVTLSATEQVQTVIFIKGRISYEDDIKDTVAVADQSALEAELKANALSRGIIVEDIANIH